MTTPPPPAAEPAVPPAVVVEEPVGDRRSLQSALFFTKGGSLDLGWLILAVCCIVGLMVFAAQAVGIIPKDMPSREAWAWFGAFTVMAFIAGAARDRAALIAKSTAVGAVAQGIAAVRSSPEPNLFTDDERGRVGD